MNTIKNTKGIRRRAGDFLPLILGALGVVIFALQVAAGLLYQ